MIKGLGTDLVDIDRMASKIEKEAFLKITFTEGEISYCQGKKYPAQHYAARFAAKEAYMKAIGTGWSKEADFKEIEVINIKSGQPIIKLLGGSLTFFQQSNFNHIFVSLSHTDKIANATVIISG
jgi:holo-[acyl-carrier protein] synthase